MRYSTARHGIAPYPLASWSVVPPLADLEADDLRIVVAHLVGVFGVDVHDVVVESPGISGRGAEQDVVENLRVALEHVAVALCQRQRRRQVDQESVRGQE